MARNRTSAGRTAAIALGLAAAAALSLPALALAAEMNVGSVELTYEVVDTSPEVVTVPTMKTAKSGVPDTSDTTRNREFGVLIPATAAAGLIVLSLAMRQAEDDADEE